jgi:hypothetical protein
MACLEDVGADTNALIGFQTFAQGLRDAPKAALQLWLHVLDLE